MEVIDKKEYISKIEVVRILQKAYAEGRIKAKDGCVSLLDDINALPSADVQPVKRGRWVCVNEDETVFMCTNCGGEVQFEVGCPKEFLNKYCMYCGARMDGDTE